MYSIIYRYTINHEYPLSKNVYNFQGSMSLFLWLCFFITYLTLPLNLYWKQFVSTCDIVIIDSRMPRHSCFEMRVMQCMTYFFCASLQVYTSFRSAQNHCPPDNVRPAGGYIRWEIDSPTDTDLLLATYRGGSNLTSDIYINTKCCILPQIFELILSDWNKQNTGNVNRYKL